MVNGLQLYTHQCNQWPLKALYNIAQHSPIHADIHTPIAVSTTQDASQPARQLGSSQGEGVSLRDTSTQLGGAGDRTSKA